METNVKLENLQLRRQLVGAQQQIIALQAQLLRAEMQRLDGLIAAETPPLSSLGDGPRTNDQVDQLGG